MKRFVATALVLAGCGDGDPPPIPFVEVAAVPVTVNRNVDVLFVLDDSTSGVEMQGGVMNAFPGFLATLGALDGGLPNLHIGTISTDGLPNAVNSSSPAGTIRSHGVAAASAPDRRRVTAPAVLLVRLVVEAEPAHLGVMDADRSLSDHEMARASARDRARARSCSSTMEHAVVAERTRLRRLGASSPRAPGYVAHL